MFPSSRKHLLFFLAGVAATLAVALVFLLPRESKEDRRFLELFQNEIYLTDQRHAAISKIFHENERLFGHNLQWVAETSETVELGLSETPSDAAPMVVRVTVLRKDANGEWSKLWRMDVVARLDGVFEMNEPGDAQHLSLSLRRTSETTTFVESRLTLANGIVLNAQSSDANYFGAPKGVKVVSDGGVFYAIIQTVKSIVGGG